MSVVEVAVVAVAAYPITTKEQRREQWRSTVTINTLERNDQVLKLDAASREHRATIQNVNCVFTVIIFIIDSNTLSSPGISHCLSLSSD